MGMENKYKNDTINFRDSSLPFYSPFDYIWCVL